MKFDWTKFDNAFLLDVIEDSELPQRTKQAVKEYSDDKDYLASKMNLICTEPNKKFILKYRAILEQEVLKFHKTEITKICKALKIQADNHNERQIKLSKKATSTSLIQAYINAMWSISGKDFPLTEFSKFKSTVAINMTETVIEDVTLYPFQEEVVASLEEQFITQNKEKGIMVMPTGSGKSRTATYFLIKDMISRGYQILWIAHRHMLIDQAADCFDKFAGLAKIENPKMRNYHISCISGEHMSIRQAGKHEVIVASIQSICRNKQHLRRVLRDKVMIVVDECHHTYADSYQDVIQFVQKNRKNTKLLGLTATPIRANEHDSNELLKLFGNNIICNISMSNLIAQGILAEPKFKRIETQENFEPEITPEEANAIRHYKELPESLIQKIASSNARNQIILKEYLDHKEVYGKTLMFALSIVHCRFLYEELVKAGVKCGYVFSGKSDNTHQITLFKENKIDVLVNVNIMTEGTDVPDIQTIFLTRPTESESLLMQMIGRGMRGKHAHGTEDVNIVDFHDQWDTFNKWLNPQWLILEEEGETDRIPKEERRPVTYVEYEWKICREAYQSMHFQAAATGCVMTLPVGWFTLIDEEGEPNRVLVFENQLQGYLKMMADKKQWRDDKSISASQMLQKYFSSFGQKPTQKDIELLMDNERVMEITPQIHSFHNRKSVDPYYVVKRIKAEGLDVMKEGPSLYEQSDVLKDLYPDAQTYTLELCKTMLVKSNKVLGANVEELPVELIPFNREPCYDLSELVQEVKEEMFEGTYDGVGAIRWTDKPYRTYYGMFHGADQSIDINCVLNSKDVPREAVKFVIYHELLHRDNMTHNPAFKEKERLYPNFEECEYFLDGKMGDFDIVEW